jgi:hypothetical protein
MTITVGDDRGDVRDVGNGEAATDAVTGPTSTIFL